MSKVVSIETEIYFLNIQYSSYCIFLSLQRLVKSFKIGQISVLHRVCGSLYTVYCIFSPYRGIKLKIMRHFEILKLKKKKVAIIINMTSALLIHKPLSL